MSIYAVKVVADTDPAKKAFKALGAELQKQGKKFALDKSGLAGYQKALKDVGNASGRAAKQVVASSGEIAKNLEASAKAANPRTFLTGAFQSAASAAMKLVDTLSKVTIALYGINAAAGALTRSFGKLFNETIGRAAQFEATLLKTKTTLASTNDVFVGGQKVEDPLKAIEALTGSIDERINSIRMRTLELAGVTSGQVVEVFGIVASQAGQIGASLEEAEDLAINFAGALGTFGIPLYQARQEITSILQGTVNSDSYLAKALQISNEDLQKDRSQIGGTTKFLQDKLGTAVAGQAIAAKQLSGVTSNIVEVW